MIKKNNQLKIGLILIFKILKDLKKEMKKIVCFFKLKESCKD